MREIRESQKKLEQIQKGNRFLTDNDLPVP